MVDCFSKQMEKHAWEKEMYKIVIFSESSAVKKSVLR